MTEYSPELEQHINAQWARIDDIFNNDALRSISPVNTACKFQFANVIVASDFFVDQCLRFPKTWEHLSASGVLERSLETGDMRRLLADFIDERLDRKQHSTANVAMLDKTLRQFRRYHMLRIIWRDINKLAPLAETLEDLSAMADACIVETTNIHYGWLTPQWGTPCYPNTNTPLPLIVLGMGKLGARELNLSSDIDLIFAYPIEGETIGGVRSIDHRNFFSRLGQQIIKSLDAVTADGFVFRVDMRLRPYGNSGALALNFDAMEAYYEEQGREWERYAMIKARPISDNHEESERLMTQLRPFIYRRYVDFGVIESLREMKGLIAREVLRKNAHNNVKTGSGGIREIEFIAQAFQLIRGGKDASLQIRNVNQVLDVVQHLQLLSANDVSVLKNAYVFLRDTEHRLQALADRQTQTLPDTVLEQERLALAMGFASWAEFETELAAHRERVDALFAAVVAPADDVSSDLPEQALSERLNIAKTVWLDTLSDSERQELLVTLQYAAENTETVHRILEDFKALKPVTHLTRIAQERLDKLMPLVLVACGQQDDSCTALQRVMLLVEAILRRSSYMSLLVENPSTLDRLAHLSSASAWVNDLMVRYPVLLDELIDPNSLYSPPKLPALQNELRQLMLRIPEDDVEQQMDCLRQFKNVHLLRVAAAEMTGSLPLMQVSDYLTWTAETLLHEVLALAWYQMVQRHGMPCDREGNPCDKSFIVVAYGKMGGLELSYLSDLDLVFIHGADSKGVTDGERSIDNGVFFARLGQKIIHIVSTRTASGMLYETDMRLRPSGNSGVLVSSLESFAEYQHEQAWTWEKQALVRARVVAGCPDLERAFYETRATILSEPRVISELADDVVSMRNKMSDHLGLSKKHYVDEADFRDDVLFQVKHDPGGIVDIEFISQFFVLAYAHQHPSLLTWPDNVRILEAVAKAGLLSKESATTLIEAYLAYRAQTHTSALQNSKTTVPGTQFTESRLAVRQIWHQVLGGGEQ